MASLADFEAADFDLGLVAEDGVLEVKVRSTRRSSPRCTRERLWPPRPPPVPNISPKRSPKMSPMSTEPEKPPP